MIPFHLVTGFLGSGKTTFLKELLAQYSNKQRIAVVQNEFAESGIDGKELQESGWKFDLLEVNKGSVFCVCLFSDFRGQLSRFVDEFQPDMVVLEATGLADPIAISELLMDCELQKQLFLAKVWTIVDALHFEKVKQMPAVKNQILIADEIIVNKSDLTNTESLDIIRDEIVRINPLAKINFSTFCKLDTIKLMDKIEQQKIEGKPNSAPQGIRTQVYRTPYTIKQKNLDYLISQLNDDIYRLKGYVRLDNNEALMIQSVFGLTTLTPVKESILSTEFISIGTKVIDYEFILRKLVMLK